jgi:5-methylcytosine-specific restriction endonuclease McrA
MGLLWRSLVRGVFKSLDLDSPYAAQEYGVNWSKQRRKCLERDDYTCRVCGTDQSEIGQEPSVHHITPRTEFDGTPREMNALDNLVALCPTCHGRLEGTHTDCSVDEFVTKARHDNP